MWTSQSNDDLIADFQDTIDRLLEESGAKHMNPPLNKADVLPDLRILLNGDQGNGWNNDIRCPNSIAWLLCSIFWAFLSQPSKEVNKPVARVGPCNEVHNVTQSNPGHFLNSLTSEDDDSTPDFTDDDTSDNASVLSKTELKYFWKTASDHRDGPTLDATTVKEFSQVPVLPNQFLPNAAPEFFDQDDNQTTVKALDTDGESSPEVNFLNTEYKAFLDDPEAGTAQGLQQNPDIPVPDVQPDLSGLREDPCGDDALSSHEVRGPRHPDEAAERGAVGALSRVSPGISANNIQRFIPATAGLEAGHGMRGRGGSGRDRKRVDRGRNPVTATTDSVGMVATRRSRGQGHYQAEASGSGNSRNEVLMISTQRVIVAVVRRQDLCHLPSSFVSVSTVDIATGIGTNPEP